jgi:predicted nicotinamide N-methyase
VLDHPEIVRGKTVLDFATGSGLVAIATARAGASRVVAVDVDPLARAACSLAVRENGVKVEVVCEDRVGRAVEEEIVLAGDVWYESGPAKRFEPWFRGLARTGARVCSGDPGRPNAPKEGVRDLARYDVPTPEDLEGARVRSTRVFDFIA